MKKLLCMILAFLLVACSMSAVITSYADDSVNLLANATNANGDITWDSDIDVRSNSIDSTSDSVYGGHTWTFGLGNTDHKTEDYERVYIKAYGLKAGTNYDFSYVYQKDYKFAIDSIKDANGNVADFTTPNTFNLTEKTRSYKVSTNVTVPVDGDYTITLKTGKCASMRASDCAWDVVILSDLRLFKGVALEDETINRLKDATYANGDVSWTTTTNVADRIGDIGAWGSNDNTSNSVNGGYSWTFGLGDGKVGGDNTYTTSEYKETYAYVYIKAKGLTANTRYDFSFIYQRDFSIVLDKITDKNGTNVELEIPTTDNSISGGVRARQVSTTFKAPVDGDYTITLKTNRTMTTPGCEWSRVILSDLVLIKSNAAQRVKAEVQVSGNGDATVSNANPSIGTEVTYTAIPWLGEEFLGWYNGDEKVSDNKELTFSVTGKITLTAKFTSVSLNVLAGKKASDWTGYQWAKIQDSTESKNGGKGYLVNDAMWQSMYTKVTLKPNTEYKFSFNWKAVSNTSGPTFPGAIKVYSASAADIEDRATNWQDGDYKPKSGNDLEQGGGYATEDIAKTYQWQNLSTGFTTTSDTEYNVVILFDISGSPNKQAINVSDFILEEANPSEQPEQLTDITNLDASAWVGYQWSKIENSTESKNGGKGYLVKEAMYQNMYTHLTLKPNTKYNLSFAWKSVANSVGVVFPNYTVVVSDKDINIDDRANWSESDFKYGNFDLEKGGNFDVKDAAETLEWQSTTVSFDTKEDSKYSFLIHFQANGNGHQQIYVSDFKLEEVGSVGGDTPPAHTELSQKAASEWRGVRWPKISDSTDSKNGGKAYLLESIMSQNINTTLSLKANTKYKVSFNWKAVANDKGLVYLQNASIYSSKSGNPELPATNESDPNWGAACNYKFESWNDYTPIYLPDVGYRNLIDNNSVSNPNGNSATDDSVLMAWNEYSANFTTTSDLEYYFFVNFGLKGANGKQSAIVSDFKLEELGPAEGGDNEETAENLAASYNSASGHVSWTDNGGTHFVDSISDLDGGYSWGFGMPNSDINTNPVYVTIKTDALKAGNKYEFSFVYQKDFIILFDSIDNGAEIFKEAEDVKLLEGDRAHRVTFRFTATKDGAHNIKLKMGKGLNNQNCQWSHVVLCDLKLFDITNRVYGVVKSELGGTITGYDAEYCTKGDEITLTATPLSGNTFKGWFDENNNLVSDKAVYKFTAENNFNYIARYDGTNIPNGEWLSLHGMDGTFENGSMPGWKAEDRDRGDDTSWAIFDRSTDMAYNGNYSLRARARYRTSFFNFTDLKKGTNYHLSFYVNDPDKYIVKPNEDAEKSEYNEEALIARFEVRTGATTVYSAGNTSNPQVVGGSGWYKIDIYFNSGDNTEAEWSFYYTDKDYCPIEYIYLDDISLVEYTSNNFENGNFENGAAPWRGDFTVENGVGKGKSFYQNLNVGTNSLYTVTFKAKGKGVAGAALINTNDFDVTNYVSSQSAVNVDSADFKTYTFEVFSSIHPDVSLFFKALEGELEVDDVVVIKAADRGNAVIDKIDFESERFALHVKSDVFEIYNGSNGDANVHSGTKSLRFNSANAKDGIEYILEDAFVSAQVSPKMNYRLILYYKTTKGNTLYIAPEYMPGDDVTVEYTAADNGWTKVDFMFNKLTASNVKVIIGNVLGKTKADFYIDDITLSITPPIVIETNSENKYCEWPLNVLNNQGFEDKITNNDWAKLPSSAEVRTDKGAAGDNYLRIKAGTKYVLPVTVSGGENYYFSISTRLGKNSSGFVAVTTNPEGTKFYSDIEGNVASKIVVDSTKWSRDSFLFSTSETGIVYIVFVADKGYIDIDEVHLYKQQYGMDIDPNDHKKFIPYNYDNPDPSTVVLNGGDSTFSGNEEYLEESPETGDTRTAPATVLVITTFAAIIVLFTAKRTRKSFKGGKA